MFGAISVIGHCKQTLGKKSLYFPALDGLNLTTVDNAQSKLVNVQNWWLEDRLILIRISISSSIMIFVMGLKNKVLREVRL